MHLSRARIAASHPAKSRRFSLSTYRAARHTILTVIILAMMTVILAVLLTSFNNPESIIKHKISTLAADYYENYFYPQIVARNTAETLPGALQYYETPGFAPLYLRQLILYDTDKNGNQNTTLSTYCDENSTFVRIYPTPPFGKTDYRMDYQYSCEF